ncbi:zf-C3HC-domain-containing protein [Xylariomycetidae sp. FL2044]|nr:zf-C3HC-domain-containing protein [Xylariomycetidae sp. FL2044]
MNSTKRKFNALLQGIGARSTHQSLESDGRKTSSRDGPLTTSLSNTYDRIPDPIAPSASIPNTSTTDSNMTSAGGVSAITADFLSKRRRVGVLESTTGNKKSGTTTISNVVLKKWIPGGDNKEPKVHSPKYSPGDRDELIRRLGTFQELTEWTPKPDEINEIEWAKRGWVCNGKERVRCTLCHKELVVKTTTKDAEGNEMNVSNGSDIEEALVKKFAELITEAHQEDCLWRRHGCDDSLLRLTLAHPRTALISLRERYDDLCMRPSFLPYLFNLRLPPTLDLEAVKTQLTKKFFTEPPPLPNTNSSTPNDVALALALTGWQGLNNPRIGAVPNSATCATCLRRLGLWMFKSKEVDEETGQIVVPAPMDHLDPVREHRFFCPWRNAAAQHNPGSKTNDNKTAWEILAQTIKNDSYLRRQAEKSNQRFTVHRPTSSVPVTPSRETNADADVPSVMLGPDMVDDEEEDPAVRDAKDKERWARLRRVKSLFDTKNGRKLRRTLSRPGTASSRPPTSGHSRQGSEAAAGSGQGGGGK